MAQTKYPCLSAETNNLFQFLCLTVDVQCSPRSNVQYSDRFIPCRNTAARLNFSLADKEAEGDGKNVEREENTQVILIH